MQLLVSIVTDWLFVFCIVLICDYYLALNKRDNTYKYILQLHWWQFVQCVNA